MALRGATAVLSRAARIKQKLQSALKANVVELRDLSHRHASHVDVKDYMGETHYNLKVVSAKFEGQSLLKRHQMVHELLADELQSGLHALSIVAKTPKEAGLVT